MNVRPSLPPGEAPSWVTQLASQLHRHDGASLRDLLPLATAISALERAGQERDRELTEVKSDMKGIARDLGAQITSSYGALRAEMHATIAESEKRQLDQLKEVEGRLNATVTGGVQQIVTATTPSREAKLMEVLKLALLVIAALVIGSEGAVKLLGG